MYTELLTLPPLKRVPIPCPCQNPLPTKLNAGGLNVLIAAGVVISILEILGTVLVSKLGNPPSAPATVNVGGVLSIFLGLTAASIGTAEIGSMTFLLKLVFPNLPPK